MVSVIPHLLVQLYMQHAPRLNTGMANTNDVQLYRTVSSQMLRRGLRGRAGRWQRHGSRQP